MTDIGADFRADSGREAAAALALGQRVGYTADVAGALGVLGRLAVGEGRLDAAAGHFGEQLAMSELVGLARVRQLAGHHEEANQLADKAAVTAREWANAPAYVDALSVAGSAHLSLPAWSCRVADRARARTPYDRYVRLNRARAHR